MIGQVVVPVATAKRLIARAIYELPTVRQAGAVEQLNYGYGAGYYGFGAQEDRGYLSGCWEGKVGSANAVTVDDLYELDDWELEAFVADEPGQAARLMGELMYGR